MRGSFGTGLLRDFLVTLIIILFLIVVVKFPSLFHTAYWRRGYIWPCCSDCIHGGIGFRDGVIREQQGSALLSMGYGEG